MKQSSHWSQLPEDDATLIAELEAIIEQPTTAASGTSLHELYNQMLAAVPAPPAGFRQQLHDRLQARLQQLQDEEKAQMSRKERPTRFSRWRLAAAVAALLIAGVALIWAFPESRARAQEILARIGGFILTDEPTLQEQALTRTPEPIATTTALQNGNQPDYFSTLDEAREQADLRIYSPQAVPEGYSLNQPQAYALFCCQDNRTVEVATTYISADYEDLIIIRQIRLSGENQDPLQTFPIGDAPLVDVMVRGQEGVWVDGSLQGSRQNESGTTELAAWSILLWEEDGFLFWIYNNALSLDEALELAESLTP